MSTTDTALNLHYILNIPREDVDVLTYAYRWETATVTLIAYGHDGHIIAATRGDAGYMPDLLISRFKSEGFRVKRVR